MNQPRPQSDRPNILMIMSDQQRWDSLGCYGQTAIETPNLDSLASAGVLFETCYANNPICTPARASLFTGKHILGHGVTKLYDSTMIRDDRYKLSFYHAVPEVGAEASIQLFDMIKDPNEQQNLAGDPDYSQPESRLLTQLVDWLHTQSQTLESQGAASLPGEDWKSSINNRY